MSVSFLLSPNRPFRLNKTAIAAACASAALPLHAQTADMPRATLDTIVVTASGFEQNVTDAPASISVIPREKLEKGNYKDLHDALRDVPGVILTPSDNNARDISLRGMGANYTLILVDGRRTSTRETQTNGSTGTDQSWIPPLEAIERIEVVRGPMSSLYGSDAIGGVINIITRKVATEWHGSARVDTTLQQHSRSGDQHQGNFYLSGPIKQDLLGLSLTGVYSHREEDRVYQGYNGYTNRGLTAKLALTPNSDHDIVLEAGGSRQEFDSRPGRTLEEGEADSFRKFKRQSASLAHTGRWSFGLSDTYLQREKTENIARDMTITNTTFSSSLTSPLFDNHMATAGVFYLREQLEDSTTNTISDLSNVDRWQYALYAEDEWQLTDSFALTGGIRFDKNEVAGTHWSPRLYGVWHLMPRWTVKGGVSTGFRAPSLRQTIPDWGAVSRGGNMYGNPDLQPEKSLSKEIGVVYEGDGGMQAGVTLFDNKFEDKITRVPCPECGPPNNWGRLPTTYVNVDDAITRGVEASLSTPITRTLSATSSYTYTYSKQKSGEYAGSPLNQLPKHMFNLGLDWTIDARTEAWTRLSFRGKESDPTQGASSGSSIAPSVTLVDLGGSYKLNTATTLYAGVYNVFDKDVFYDDYGYVEDGRRFWLGMNVKF
ncbi:ligand-gated channel protein [Verticiella sediminum]|uniref:Ligand-gated channel protein n=1 Tax=Verticiella sediminum TaxID=1247510 RepID=A0A556ARX8_9BURK|nr:ligand-gated channel protein [Verticiella sediminum]TSH95711.1 ligand-gated channel protein [Verticiella sediminum]